MNLKVARARREVSQWAIAVKTGISQPKLSLIEKGYVIPSPEERELISGSLNLNVEEIEWPEVKK